MDVPTKPATMKRVDIKAILADDNLRKELMVGTIQALQAREGIETTREQAEWAYDKVQLEKATHTMRTQTIPKTS